MAKTVAEIDGDSSGLVSELDKAKTALGDMGTKGKKSIDDLDKAGKKLTDQLRDVADQADVAAGALVNKIGGPTAIKAIAGVGGAFVVAENALAAFSSSMSAYASTQGAAGQQAMADLDTALNELQGQLFTAVMGTNDMHDAMETVVNVVKAATLVVQAILFPLSVFTTGIRTLADNSSDAEVYQKKLAAAEREAAKAADVTSTAVVTLNSKYKDVEATLIRLLGTKKEAALFDLDSTTAELMGVIRVAEAVEFARLKQKGDLAADRAELEARENAADSGEGGGAEMLDVNIDAVRDEARQKAVKQAAEEMKGDDARKARVIEGLKEVEKTRQDILSGRKVIPEDDTPTGGGGGGGDKDKPETEAERGARLLAEAQAAVDAALAEMDAIKALREKNDKDEQQLELDKMKWTIDQNQVKYDAIMDQQKRAKDFEQKLEDEYAAAKHAAGELTEAEEEERNAARLKAVQDLAGAELGTYMQSAGKQLAIGKLSAKAAADMARSQLGNVIIGQGDKAMAEAGIMAAALNPLAIPMAAAGLAAYAIGNAMMPTAKPTAGSTPATEKAEAAAPAATNNYAFNMRVDSVFADGESVARQFAMMQESARQRGLLTQGAY
jgi:hypothetical protein